MTVNKIFGYLYKVAHGDGSGRRQPVDLLFMLAMVLISVAATRCN